MEKRKSYKRAYRKKPKMPIYRRRWFWSAALLLFLVLTLIYLFVSPLFWVTEIEILGASALDSAEILPIVKEEIVLNIPPLRTKSIFLISESKIRDRVMTAFPQLSSVKVRRIFPRAIAVTVVERKAVASWCRDYGECFLIDRGGVLFKEAPDTVQLAVIKGGVQTASLSESPISPDEIKFMSTLSKGLKDVVGLLLFESDVPNLFVRTTEGWEIRLTFTKPPQIQTDKLILVLEKRIPAEKRDELEYVDVRFENRVYYKYKEY